MCVYSHGIHIAKAKIDVLPGVKYFHILHTFIY